MCRKWLFLLILRQLNCPGFDGRYYRNLGWGRDQETGGHSQPKFWLGKDLVQADRRCQRLEELWERVEELWTTGNRGANDRPAWDTFTLRVAKQLARGEWQVAVTWHGESPAAYAQKLNTLAARYPCLQFVPEDNARYIAGQLYNEQVIDASVADALGAAKEMGYAAGAPIHDGQGTLHQAFDAYVRWLKDHKHKAWINTQVQQVNRLEDRHPDIPLSALDFDACDAMIRLWRNRPMVKGRNEPISAKTGENHIKQLKAFFRWLHRSQLFSWRKPEDTGRNLHPRGTVHPERVRHAVREGASAVGLELRLRGGRVGHAPAEPDSLLPASSQGRHDRL